MVQGMHNASQKAGRAERTDLSRWMLCVYAYLSYSQQFNFDSLYYQKERKKKAILKQNILRKETVDSLTCTRCGELYIERMELADS